MSLDEIIQIEHNLIEAIRLILTLLAWPWSEKRFGGDTYVQAMHEAGLSATGCE